MACVTMALRIVSPCWFNRSKASFDKIGLAKFHTDDPAKINCEPMLVSWVKKFPPRDVITLITDPSPSWLRTKSVTPLLPPN